MSQIRWRKSVERTMAMSTYFKMIMVEEAEC